MKNILFLAFSLLVLSGNAQQIDRLAFGSCSFQFGKQKIWKSVVEKKPQLWVWLGDIIYADTEDMDKMRSKYGQLGANPNYNLLKKACPIIATWDDHDFGSNDIGEHYLMKKESQQIFLDFFETPVDDARRTRDGVYTSYDYGAGGGKVKVILLDTRFNRNDPGADGDMLGENQWVWLENELKNSDAKINIIGSSIQFVATIPGFENWDKFPGAQDRMLKLISSTGVKGVVFISGDVHYAETNKRVYDQVSYPIYDFTSSGLTHGNQIMGFKNPYRVGESRFGYRNFGFLEFDWIGQKLRFIEYDRKGKARFEHDVQFSELGW